MSALTIVFSTQDIISVSQHKYKKIKEFHSGLFITIILTSIMILIGYLEILSGIELHNYIKRVYFKEIFFTFCGIQIIAFILNFMLGNFYTFYNQNLKNILNENLI